MPYGEAALLAEPGDAASVLDLAAAAAELPGVREVVPAARTVLVVLESADLVQRVSDSLRERAERAATDVAPDGEPLVLDVRYDGADLTSTADELGLDADGLVRAHSDGEYVVAFCGFVPGFGYLTGLPEALHVARFAEPRTRVPAGSVAIAGEFTGVYPRSSPGGWRLLGHTSAPLWDLDRTPPALLSPGTRVRFRPS